MVILVYLEYRRGNIAGSSLQVLAKAYELSREGRHEVCAAVIGRDVQQAASQLTGLPITKAYLYEADDLFSADLYSEIFTSCIAKLSPSVVLIGGTKEGKSLSSRTAAMLKTGVTVDCTDVRLRGRDELVQIRPAYGGNVIAQIVTEKQRPQIAVLTDSIMPPVKRSSMLSPATVLSREYASAASAVKLIERRELPKVKRISSYDVIVAAGRGVKRKEDLVMLEALARKLGGGLGATRGLVERGWMPHARQIGLSGHSIRVKLLIACGLSGTVQFMAGVRRADCVIAVNSDESAGIFQWADYGFCGDLQVLLPMLLEKMENPA